jgi:hypothetical protein
MFARFLSSVGALAVLFGTLFTIACGDTAPAIPSSAHSGAGDGVLGLGVGNRNLLVDDDGMECKNADYNTIQDAVDAAGSRRHNSCLCRHLQ